MRVPEDKAKVTIWGRANSVNVQKVLWCLSELDLAYAAATPSRTIWR